MPARIVNMHDAKTNLSALVKSVLAGEEVIIARANKPLVKLVPIEPPKREKRLGWARGKIWMAPDFDDPLPDSFWFPDKYDPLTSKGED